MLTVGIIGGVGPDTTSKIYLGIVDYFKKNGKRQYPSILMYNLPFPFAIENEAIVEGRNAHKMIPYLINGAKVLEKGGADFAILPCNTLHKYMDQLRQSVSIPFLSILEESVKKMKASKVKTVGILATTSSINDQLYDGILKQNNIKILYPTEVDQNILSTLIVDLLNGNKSSLHRKTLQRICASLQRKGADAILLACTDLQLIASNIKIKIPVIDTTNLLLKATVQKMTHKKGKFDNKKARC